MIDERYWYKQAKKYEAKALALHEKACAASRELTEAKREIARIREIIDGCEWCRPYARPYERAADSASVNQGE
jgi:hypothetical protein